MKKKIGEIYNKPIVTGDKNLVTKNEIHESTLKGGGTVDSGSSDVEYYRYDGPNIGFEKIAYSILQNIVELVKGSYYDDGMYYSILPKDIHNKSVDYAWERVRAVSVKYLPMINYVFEKDDNGNKVYCNSVKEYLTLIVNSMNSTVEELFTQCGLTPITKEEFYDLNNI